MKTFCMILAAWCSASGLLFAQESAFLSLKKQETPTSGTSNFQLQLIAVEDIEITSALQWEVPTGMTVVTNTTIPTYLSAGDTVYIGTSLQYNTNNLPFYPEDIKVIATVTSLTSNAGAKLISPIPTNPETVFAEGKVYFTPYNTTEIWSIDAFMQAGRSWQLPENPTPARKYIPKEAIPISDLVNLTVPCDEDSLELVHIEGLAYDIPMFPSHALAYKTLPGDDVAPDEGVAAKTTVLKTFSGTVSGRLVTNYVNDLGVSVIMPLTGVNIVLKDRDFGINQVIKQVHTDQNGFFVIEYNTLQEFTEKINWNCF